MRFGVCHVLLLAMGAAILGGCDSRPDVATYAVPKDPVVKDEPSPAAPGQMRALPGMAESTANLHQPEWQAPQGWQALPLDAIRRGAWRIAGADGTKAEVTVTVFPGDVGGLLLNVNRWRGQIALPDINEAELPQYVANRTLGGESSQIVTLVNEASGKTSITALVPHDGATWFFKIMGDSPLITAQSPQWDAFLQSIHFAGH